MELNLVVKSDVLAASGGRRVASETDAWNRVAAEPHPGANCCWPGCWPGDGQVGGAGGLGTADISTHRQTQTDTFCWPDPTTTVDDDQSSLGRQVEPSDGDESRHHPTIHGQTFRLAHLDAHQMPHTRPHPTYSNGVSQRPTDSNNTVFDFKRQKQSPNAKSHFLTSFPSSFSTTTTRSIFGPILLSILH